MNHIFGYDGKQVVITGAASGMGEAAARLLVDLRAEVYAVDVKEVSTPVKQFIKTDLKDKASIDAATKHIPDKIYALFNCAGLPGPPFSNLDVTLVNFVGHRHLTETLLPRINDGGAIASISSVGGMGWTGNIRNVNNLLATKGFDEACAWLEANPEANDGYMFSKQCIIAYTKARAGELAKRNIRINCICPGPTATPMMKIFHESYGKDNIERHLSSCGRYATPEEVAEPLIFLNSRMARHVSGDSLLVDFGQWAEIESSQRRTL